MKLLPKQTRVNTGDSLGHGMDAVIMLVLFLAAGYGLDRLFGTVPVFMVVLTVLGSVGLFLKFKYAYGARMDELDAQRVGRMTTRQPVAPTADRTVAASNDRHDASSVATPAVTPTVAPTDTPILRGGTS